MKIFKRGLFSSATIEDLIHEELIEAQLALLRSQTALDWAKSNVEYNTRRIERLEASLNEISLQPTVAKRVT